MIHCTKCGTENNADSSFCQKCGKQLSSGFSSDVGANTGKPIWDPTGAALLSLFFTPVFGTYIQMKNWQTLGLTDKAASAKMWFFAAIVLLLAGVGINIATATPEATGGLGSVLMLLFLFIWYLAFGRGQSKYVKDTLGKTYAKKPWVKAVLAGFGVMIAYFALATTTVLVANDYANAAQSQSEMAEETSVAGVTLSSANALDCASADVKSIITDNYIEEMANIGIPDMVMGLQQERIKLNVEMISEVGRNMESLNAQCSGKLTITFPQEDLNRVSQSKDVAMTQMMMPGLSMPTSNTFSAMLNYVVSIPADPRERESGPIVHMEFQNGDAAGEELGRYGAAYTLLSYSAADITSESRNDKPWDKDWKEVNVQECAKQADINLCRCKLDQFEKVLNQADMWRIGYNITTNPLLANRYRNFVQHSESLVQQCTNGGRPDASIAATTPLVGTELVESNKSVQQNVQQSNLIGVAATSAELQTIQASFDCAKASNKIEKLICSSPETANADKRLAAAYNAAKQKVVDEKQLRAEQLDWMKQHRSACNDTACLVNAMEQRIQSLIAMN